MTIYWVAVLKCGGEEDGDGDEGEDDAQTTKEGRTTNRRKGKGTAERMRFEEETGKACMSVNGERAGTDDEDDVAVVRPGLMVEQVVQLQRQWQRQRRRRRRGRKGQRTDEDAWTGAVVGRWKRRNGRGRDWDRNGSRTGGVGREAVRTGRLERRCGVGHSGSGPRTRRVRSSLIGWGCLHRFAESAYVPMIIPMIRAEWGRRRTTF